jgi:hypothetical protein
LRRKVNSLIIRSLCVAADPEWFQISLIIRYRPRAVIFSSLVSKLILFRIWSKLQKYNKKLPELNVPAGKSLMSNFFIQKE